MAQLKKGDKVRIIGNTKQGSVFEFKSFKQNHPEKYKTVGTIRDVFKNYDQKIYVLTFGLESGSGWYFHENEIEHAKPSRLQILEQQLNGEPKK